MKREWSLDELVALFPHRAPDREGAVINRPAGPASGRARFTDEEAAGTSEAEVALSLGPGPEFKIRVAHSWPEGMQETQQTGLRRALLLGIFRAADRFSLPSALGSCEVSIDAVVCNEQTTERAVQVAALRATEAALAECEWTTFTAPFPGVSIEPGENLEKAFMRACQAYQAAGYDARGESFYGFAGQREFTRAFKFMIGGPWRYAYYFFVCPFEWSDELTAEIEKLLPDISYQEARDTEHTTRFHFLAAHPLPLSLATRSDVGVWLVVLKRTLPGSGSGGAFVPSSVLCINGPGGPLEVHSRPAVVFLGSGLWAAAWSRARFLGGDRSPERLRPGEVATLQDPTDPGAEASWLEVRVSGDHAGRATRFYDLTQARPFSGGVPDLPSVLEVLPSQTSGPILFPVVGDSPAPPGGPQQRGRYLLLQQHPDGVHRRRSSRSFFGSAAS